MAGFWQIVFNLVRARIFDVSIGLLYNGLGALTGLTAVVLFFILRKKYPEPKKRSA